MKYSLILSVLALLSIEAIGQNSIAGSVADSETGASLPFVHVVSAHAKAVSDIEGVYRLKPSAWAKGSDTVRFTLVGYETGIFLLADLIENPKVKLNSKALNLAEFTVTAKEDPAYAMIRKAVERRKANDPLEIDKFKFRSYNKAYMDILRSDTIQAELNETGFANAHFFMVETATEVIFEKPNRINEKVLANRMSGFQNPAFSLQSNTMQPFSSYTPYLQFIGIDFLNPISPNSEKRYLFQLNDSVETAEGKAYIISFSPRKNASGNLLEGTLTLDGDEWAIVSIQAKNSGQYNLADFEVRQAYEKVSGKWFPSQSASKYGFPLTDIEEPMLMISNTYIDSVDFEYTAPKGAFGIADISMDPKANTSDEDTWKTYRVDDLSEEERNTFKVYDTLDVKVLNTMNWVMSQTNSLARGRLSFGKMDVLLPHIMRFNQYEGFRLGIGLATNYKLIKWMSPEAYFAYGFGDEEIKYGGGLRFFIQPKREFELFVGYKNDVEEPGRRGIMEDRGFTRLGDVTRSLFTRRMNPVETYYGAISYRPFRGLKTELRLSREERFFEQSDIFNEFGTNYSLITSEIGLRFVYRPGEPMMLVGNTLLPQTLKYPRIQVDIAYAIPDLFDSQQEYTRAEVQVLHETNIRGLGAMRLFASAGDIVGEEVNEAHLFLGRGIRGEEDFGIVAFGYFQTMPLYTFLNDRYVHLGISQNLGNPFGFERAFTRPEIMLMYQAAIGDLRNDVAASEGIPLVGMTEAYLEGGLVVDNILRLSGNLYYSGFGLGVFYRHGAYESAKTSDNLAYALSFAISF